MLDTNHSRKFYPIIALLLLLLLAAGGYIVLLNIKQHRLSTADEKSDVTLVSPTPGSHDDSLADLGTRPDWSTLDLWQETITRDDFFRLLTEVYTLDDSWKRYITVHPDHAIIRTDTRKPGATYRLNFSSILSEASPNRNWSGAGELAPGTTEKPLAGVHIAIDPGHIGGEFAKIEERWFQMGNHQAVQEGDMTLITGKIIKKKLIKLGAKVYLIRGDNKQSTHIVRIFTGRQLRPKHDRSASPMSKPSPPTKTNSSTAPGKSASVPAG